MADDVQRDTEPHSYKQYEQDHEYIYDNGLVVLPVASDTPAHVVIKLHGGVGMRRLKWRAARDGKPPQIPAMADTDYDTFVGGKATVLLPQPNPLAAGYNWSVHGEYLFVQTRPRVAGVNALPTGTFPFPVAPNDALANVMVQSYMSAFDDADPDTENPADVLATAIGDGEVDHDTEKYLWPLTVLPPIFSTDTLIGA